MSLHTFKHEFEQAVSLLPPPPRPFALDDGVGDAVAEFETALKVYRRSISSWRSRMLLHVPKFEALLSRAEKDSDPAAIRYLVDDLMPQVIGLFDEAITDMEERQTLSAETQQRMNLAASISSHAAKAARSIVKKYRSAVATHIEYLTDLRDRLKMVIWNHDPDARGGPTFENIDDLIAHLNS